MPVYNGAMYLKESVDSILTQTFTDFEFIIINDGSSDTSLQILQAYAVRDWRIKIINNLTNQKIARSLNTGIDAARSPLIARMDADDWAYPTRLEKQYNFMQEHPEVDICGSALNVYSTDETWLPPCENQHIRAQLLFHSCIYHPTVMFKKAKILDYCHGYAERTQPAEDYDLWARLSVHSDVIFANIPESLLRYRTYPIEERFSYYDKQKQSANMVRASLIHNLFPGASQEDLNSHLILSGVEDLPCPEKLHTCGEWVKTLLAANTQGCVYDHETLHKIALQHWLSVCKEASLCNITPCYTYYKTGLHTTETSFLGECVIMVIRNFIAKFFPPNTRRRKLLKTYFYKYKMLNKL